MKEKINFQETTQGEKFPFSDDYIEIMEKEGLGKYGDAYKKVIEISESVKEKGGRALLVGGSVRDYFMEKIPKDFDLEIYGLDAGEVEAVISEFGRISEVGKAFGVLKIFLGNGVDIDISLPRTDSKVSEGHRGFAVETDPEMTVEEAAKRRDFTMNSLAADPLSGKIYDYFGGVRDIRNKRLKVTDFERFKDDPLRVMRAMQFVGRFGMELDKDSVPIIQDMSLKLKELPKERLSEEWKKLLLKSEKPSLGLSFAMSLGILHEIHPELPPLAQTKQDPRRHPEGNVWMHTLMVVDEAAKIIKENNLEEEKALIIMLSALCHDFGKAKVTQIDDAGKIISHKHEKAGEEPTKKFLSQIGVSSKIRDKVVKLVINHMIPTALYLNEHINGQKVSDGVIRRLAERIYPCTIQELVLLAEADHLGRGFDDREKHDLLLDPNEYSPAEWLLELARKLNIELSKPADLTRGKDFIGWGYEQGENIGKLIKLANRLRDKKGFSRKDFFCAINGIETAEEAIKKLEKILKK